jgi:hypothetical protein
VNLKRPEQGKGGPRAVSARAVTIGIFCAALLCAFTPYNDFKIAATYVAGNQFPIGAIFVLIFLAGVVNTVLRRFHPAAAFTRGELLTIWTLILVASGLPSSGLMRYFIPYIVAPHYYSDNANDWERKIWGGAPDWLKIQDKAAADAFFTGYDRGEERIPWESWGGPLFFWGILAVLFLLASFCVASLLRRQWVENEKWTFPLVALPALLAEEPRGSRLVNDLFHNPYLWVGAGLTTALHTTKGLHLLYPFIPDITTSLNVTEYLTVRPWDQLGRTEIYWFPLVIGLSYLLPAEVSFSIWFFYLFYKAELLLGGYYNWNMPAGLGSYGYTQFHLLQAFGGAIALMAWTLWAARAHLRDVWEKATGGPRAPLIDDGGEMLGYRAAVAGLTIAYGGIGLWLYLAHVPVPLIALALVIMTMVFVVASWMICQAGMLYTQTPYGSLDVLAPTLGTARLDIPPLYTVARVEGMLVYDTREMLLPSLLNGAKTAEAGDFSARRLFRAMVLSVVIGLVISAVASLWLPYHNGGANALQNPWMYSTSPQKPLRFLGGAVSVPYVGAWTNGLHILGGLVGVLLLLVLRAQVGWGLHPIGFLGASVSSARTLWFSIFVGWILKALIQRYGGMRGYLTLLPFFLGLIVGDVLSAVLWIALGYLTGTGYKLLPG